MTALRVLQRLYNRAWGTLRRLCRRLCLTISDAALSDIHAVRCAYGRFNLSRKRLEESLQSRFKLVKQAQLERKESEHVKHVHDLNEAHAKRVSELESREAQLKAENAKLMKLVATKSKGSTTATGCDTTLVRDCLKQVKRYKSAYDQITKLFGKVGPLLGDVDIGAFKVEIPGLLLAAKQCKNNSALSLHFRNAYGAGLTRAKNLDKLEDAFNASVKAFKTFEPILTKSDRTTEKIELQVKSLESTQVGPSPIPLCKDDPYISFYLDERFDAESIERQVQLNHALWCEAQVQRILDARFCGGFPGLSRKIASYYAGSRFNLDQRITLSDLRWMIKLSGTPLELITGFARSYRPLLVAAAAVLAHDPSRAYRFVAGLTGPGQQIEDDDIGRILQPIFQCTEGIYCAVFDGTKFYKPILNLVEYRCTAQAKPWARDHLVDGLDVFLPHYSVSPRWISILSEREMVRQL